MGLTVAGDSLDVEDGLLSKSEEEKRSTGELLPEPLVAFKYQLFCWFLVLGTPHFEKQNYLMIFNFFFLLCIQSISKTRL